MRITPTSPEIIMPSRDFHARFSTEQILLAGMPKNQVAALPVGIHVTHAHTSKPKLIKKEIQAAFGSVITSTKQAVQKHHNRRFSRKLYDKKRRIERELAKNQSTYLKREGK